MDPQTVLHLITSKGYNHSYINSHLTTGVKHRKWFLINVYGNWDYPDKNP